MMSRPALIVYRCISLGAVFAVRRRLIVGCVVLFVLTTVTRRMLVHCGLSRYRAIRRC